MKLFSKSNTNNSHSALIVVQDLNRSFPFLMFLFLTAVIIFVCLLHYLEQCGMTFKSFETKMHETHSAECFVHVVPPSVFNWSEQVVMQICKWAHSAHILWTCVSNRFYNAWLGTFCTVQPSVDQTNPTYVIHSIYLNLFFESFTFLFQCAPLLYPTCMYQFMPMTLLNIKNIFTFLFS